MTVIRVVQYVVPYRLAIQQVSHHVPRVAPERTPRFSGRSIGSRLSVSHDLETRRRSAAVKETGEK